MIWANGTNKKQLFTSFLLWSLLSTVARCMSTDFPPVTETLEYLTLSSILYNENDLDHNLPDDLQLHLVVNYGGNPICDRTMVVSSPSKKYIAVVFRGVDSFNGHVLDVIQTTFGPEDEPIISDVKVHRGFNQALFVRGDEPGEDSLFDRVLRAIKDFVSEHPDYKVVSTGHSTGAALSVLMGAGLAELNVADNVTVNSFAAPLSGDQAFKDYVDSMDNLGVWNHILMNDIVPRFPRESWSYRHPGHTIWFKKHHAKAYYLHYGDEKQGYVGIPKEFEEGPFSFDMHLFHNYVEYIQEYSLKDPGEFYVESFIQVLEHNKKAYPSILSS